MAGTIILSASADPNYRTQNDRHIPLTRAAYNDHTASIRLLVQAGADPIMTNITHPRRI